MISQTIQVPGRFFGTNESEQLAFEADKVPADPAMMIKDRIYLTPMGPMVWTGTGFKEIKINNRL